MEEEVSIEAEYPAARCTRFDELMEAYFSSMSERICAASSHKEAEQIVHDVLMKFEKQCISEIIPLLVKRHFEKQIKECWKNR